MNEKKADSKSRTIEKIVKLFEWIAVGCLIGISVVIFTQIVLRNVFSIGFPWADELSRFLHISLIYLTVPILFREKILITVDYFVKNLSPGKRIIVKIISILSCAGFSMVFIYSIAHFMDRSWDIATPALGLPNLVFFLGTFLGMAMLLVTSLEELYNEIKRLGKGEDKIK